MSDWFDRAFGPWYLRLYPHRNTAEAEAAVSTLLTRLPVGGRILDVGCGAGRHAEILRSRGMTVLGLDRSPHLLAEAGRRAELVGRLARGDMRSLPFRSRSFAAVLSMFTSFGYFGPRDTHVRLLGEFHRVSRSGGVLVLDYLNASRTRGSLVPESRREVDDHLVLEERRIERGPHGEQTVKRVSITDQRGTTVETYEERVSLYDRSDLLEMLVEARWMPVETLGEYDGTPWSPESSRTLVIARAEGVA